MPVSTLPWGYPSGNGFEARNALFKGFVGTGKVVTFHDKPNANRLQVYEGSFTVEGEIVR